MYRLLIFVLLILSLTSCKYNSEDSELEELYSLMQGSFNSETQAKADSTYYNISLHMYPIWKQQGHYLYVEQAINSMQDKPYRQRVYQVTRVNDTLFKSAIYTLPNDSLWIGKWKDPNSFKSIKPEDLVLREGCEVYLERLGENHYKGATGEKTCGSTLRGASYATSEVEITSGRVASWDRGFDAQDNHVWGADKAGYIFDQLKN